MEKAINFKTPCEVYGGTFTKTLLFRGNFGQAVRFARAEAAKFGYPFVKSTNTPICRVEYSVGYSSTFDKNTAGYVVLDENNRVQAHFTIVNI